VAMMAMTTRSLIRVNPERICFTSVCSFLLAGEKRWDSLSDRLTEVNKRLRRVPGARCQVPGSDGGRSSCRFPTWHLAPGTRAQRARHGLALLPPSLVQPVLDAVGQRLPGGFDDVRGDADRAPALAVVGGLDEHANLRRRPFLDVD